MNANKMKRRDFLKRSGAVAMGAIGFPYIISSSAMGNAGSVAPSNRITMGCIGLGWQGTGNMKHFLEEDDARIIAVCDVDHSHLENAQNIVNEHYQNTDCVTYDDFRELIVRDDIDAVSIALPDHWHAIPAIMAARAGKDIYGEKPLSHNLHEGRAMCEAVRQYGRIWQTGSWQRSVQNFRFACELVRNGRIGKVHTVHVGLGSDHKDYSHTGDQTAPTNPPSFLDYNRWLGPAPYAFYCPARVHKNWRWNLDYGGGKLMDWVGHHVDIAHWGLGLDHTGPIAVEGTGDFPPTTNVWNAPTRFLITTEYANGIKMRLTGGMDDTIKGGTKWIGTDGWVWVTRHNIDAYPESLLKEKIGLNEIQLYNSPGHFRNFLDCIKSRVPTITPCETAHRSATPGHLGQIAMTLGRKIHFNPDTEEISNDPSATVMLSNAMRTPWHL